MKKVIVIVAGIMVMIFGTQVFAIEATSVGRVVVEKHVSRHIGQHIDLITLGPGAGWLRLITSDGLSPVISFDAVTQEEIEAFNRFAGSIDYPFRTQLKGKVLFVRHNRNRMVSRHPVIDPSATRNLNFAMRYELPPLALEKTKTGKIRLYAVRDELQPVEGGNGRPVLRGPSEYRKAGFRLIQKGFAAIADTPELNREIVLKDVRIRVVGKRKRFNQEAASYGSRVLGYATADNEITVLGKQVGDIIVVNQAVLGHELNHLLNFANLEMANPDDLEDQGL